MDLRRYEGSEFGPMSLVGQVEPLWLFAVVAGLAVVAIAAAIVGIIGWRRAVTALDTRDDSKIVSENKRIDAELKLAEMADRMRLISEMHEGAAVTISAIVSQAEGAKFAGDSNPAMVVRVAAQIADQAREVLADLRRVVNVGRQGVADATSGPSLVALDDLFASMNESGLVVKFEESGSAFALSSSAEIAVFRIVQEALNNSRQHGGPGTSVKVTMTWSTQGLQLRIDDDGVRVKNALREAMGETTGYTIADDQRALVEVLGGRGMKDMKARTEAFGGVFSAHRVPGVGFSITAAFPTLRFHNGVHGVAVGEESAQVARD